jgi:hypothetical protein
MGILGCILVKKTCYLFFVKYVRGPDGRKRLHIKLFINNKLQSCFFKKRNGKALTSRKMTLAYRVT